MKTETATPEANRRQIFLLVCGAQATGKTFLVNEIVNNYTKKVVIVDTGSDEPLWSDLPTIETPLELSGTNEKAKILFDDSKDFFVPFQKHFRNGLIVFDDGNFFMNNGRNDSLMKMLMIRRQLNIDCIFICHGLTEIAPRFWNFANRLTLFRTTDNLKRKSANTPNFEFWEQQQQEVNSEAEKDQYYRRTINLQTYSF